MKAATHSRLLTLVPVRYVVVAMIFLGMVFNYMLRVNINITIVAMVNHTALPSTNVTRSQECGGNGSSSTDGADPQQDGPFVWDESVTGYILAEFYYGYVFTQLIGGRMAELLSAKHTFGVPLLITAVLTLLVPVAAHQHWGYLMAIRVLMGVVMGVTFPASYVLLANWVPVGQMNLLVVLAQGGCDLGTVITMPMSSAIVDSLGWEAVFYIQAALSIVWFIAWMILVTSAPAQHWFITDSEKELISGGVGPQVSGGRPPPLPWRQLACSVPVWAYFCGYFASTWTYYSLLTDLPQYFNNMLGRDLSSNALFNSLPYLGLWLFTLLYGWLSDVLVSRGAIRLVNVRRLAQVVSSLIPALILIAVAYLGCNAAAVETLLVITIVLQGAGYSNCILPMNLAPHFAGTISGLGNTLASMPGFLGPLVVAAFTEGEQTLARWRWPFLVAAAIGVLGSLLLLFGVSTDEQAWNRPQKNQLSIKAGRRKNKTISRSGSEMSKGGSVAGSRGSSKRFDQQRRSQPLEQIVHKIPSDRY